MQHIIKGGAGDKLHDSKILIANSLSAEDKKLLHDFTKFKKDTNKTKFGEAKGAGMRAAAAIPYDTMLQFEKIDPEIFKDKAKFIRFLNDFPIFRTTEKL